MFLLTMTQFVHFSSTVSLNIMTISTLKKKQGKELKIPIMGKGELQLI